MTRIRFNPQPRKAEKKKKEGKNADRREGCPKWEHKGRYMADMRGAINTHATSQTTNLTRTDGEIKKSPITES